VPTSVVHLTCEKTSVILSAMMSMHDAQEDPLQTKLKITVSSQLKFVVSTYYSLLYVLANVAIFM
jgi:hypothetical protein